MTPAFPTRRSSYLVVGERLGARIVGCIRELHRRFAESDAIEHRTGLRLYAGQYDLSPGEPCLFDEFLQRLRTARIEEGHKPQAQDDHARRLPQPAPRIGKLDRKSVGEGKGG